MPYLAIQTNQDLSPEKHQQLLTLASKTVAEILGKPESYVMVAVPPAIPMLFAGSDAPLAYLELKSIGLPEEQTTRLSHALCDMINAQLNIPAERVYIEFANAQRSMWGWNGGTF